MWVNHVSPFPIQENRTLAPKLSLEDNTNKATRLDSQQPSWEVRS